jgi:hypothetical protein
VGEWGERKKSWARGPEKSESAKGVRKTRENGSQREKTNRREGRRVELRHDLRGGNCRGRDEEDNRRCCGYDHHRACLEKKMRREKKNKCARVCVGVLLSGQSRLFGDECPTLEGKRGLADGGSKSRPAEVPIGHDGGRVQPEVLLGEAEPARRRANDRRRRLAPRRSQGRALMVGRQSTHATRVSARRFKHAGDPASDSERSPGSNYAGAPIDSNYRGGDEAILLRTLAVSA